MHEFHGDEAFDVALKVVGRRMSAIRLSATVVVAVCGLAIHNREGAAYDRLYAEAVSLGVSAPQPQTWEAEGLAAYGLLAVWLLLGT
jgi:hypothetical protein